jgi:hypothetical protein
MHGSQPINHALAFLCKRSYCFPAQVDVRVKSIPDAGTWRVERPNEFDPGFVPCSGFYVIREAFDDDEFNPLVL